MNTATTKTKAAPKPRVMKYQVDHAMTSGGPQFSSITEACAYIAHCMKSGVQGMHIHRLGRSA